MNYLIDTNVISELINPRAQPQVLAWFQEVPIDKLFLSVLTLGEIRRGVEKLNDHLRKKRLILWLEDDLIRMFDMRILPISAEIADRWGRLQHQVKRTLPAIDSLIAATALHYDITLVTRNISDFSDCPGLELINPWET